MVPINTPPQSRYRQGTWTVTKLKEELRNRNLSPVGKKTELIDRLERADQTGSATPKGKKGRQPKYIIIDHMYNYWYRTDSPKVIQNLDSPRANMTVRELQEELKRLGKSPVGKKFELIGRLQQAQDLSNPFVEHQTASNLLIRSAHRMSHRGEVLSRENIATKDIGLLTSPITTLFLAFRGIYTLSQDFFEHAAGSYVTYLNIGTLLMLIFAINWIDGPHQEYLRPYQNQAIWYFRWLILGVLSSVGLGTGAHTFLLFLGPFIARVTSAAHVCQSLDFALYGPLSLLCPVEGAKSPMIIWKILNKIKWECFAWGLGTAIGELPPYLIARACIILIVKA